MNIEKFKQLNLVEEGWLKVLAPFIESKQFDDILEFLKIEKQNGKLVLPYDVDCFNAFKYCPYNELKCVIIGMDPYHNYIFNRPEAHGLAFSYKKLGEHDFHVPKSLGNILKEVARNVYKSDISLFVETDTNLERWAKQGVLLLNTALTVTHKNPGAHLALWRPFTTYLIQYLNEQNPGLIWMLWGNDAKLYKQKLNNNHHVLEAGHPSPLNCNPLTKFEGCGHFTKANELIEKMNGKQFLIEW